MNAMPSLDSVQPALLHDLQGRRFDYLRLSLTDACNYHCQYCLPNGYQRSDEASFLNIDEIENIVRAMAGLGLWKVRLTGGEPTLRKDLTDIIARISKIPGIQKIALTTNGHNLKRKAAEWRDAGLSSLNISIDSLDPTNFQRITGHNHLENILDGLRHAQSLGFDRIKINTVLLKDLNDHELPHFLAWVKDQNVDLRFIELMQTGDNLGYFQHHHLSGETIRQELIKQGWTPLTRSAGAGPAQDFQHPNYAGRIGVISPYAANFCHSCNRLRISARGALRLCLFGQGGHSLRHLMQSPDQQQSLMQTIANLLTQKPVAHQLHVGLTGQTKHLASIGG